MDHVRSAPKDTCEEYGAALLVDFEGEMPGAAHLMPGHLKLWSTHGLRLSAGHGGEVSIAQLQFTQAGWQLQRNMQILDGGCS